MEKRPEKAIDFPDVRYTPKMGFFRETNMKSLFTFQEKQVGLAPDRRATASRGDTTPKLTAREPQATEAVDVLHRTARCTGGDRGAEPPLNSSL